MLGERLGRVVFAIYRVIGGYGDRRGSGLRVKQSVAAAGGVSVPIVSLRGHSFGAIRRHAPGASRPLAALAIVRKRRRLGIRLFTRGTAAKHSRVINQDAELVGVPLIQVLHLMMAYDRRRC